MHHLVMLGNGGVQPEASLLYVEQQGVVLESARGPIPSLAEAVAGAAFKGSWWAHPKAHAIYAAIQLVRDSPDILTCRLVDSKVTYVHRRLWPAIVRLADTLDATRLAMIHEGHTASGAHRVTTTPFPQWVPPDVSAAAKTLSEAEARTQLSI